MRKAFEDNFLVKTYFNRTELERLLILSCLFSVGLTFLRIARTGQLQFVGLIWNLFLALVPYLLTRMMIHCAALTKSKTKFILLFVVWLLFIPNAFYIITDLFHLDRSNGVPLWFDLALIFSYAWNGILLGAISIRQMEKMMQ